MHCRPDAGSTPGLSIRSLGPSPSSPAPPLRGIPVDYGPRVDNRLYAIQSSSRKQQHLLFANPSVGNDQEESPPSRHLWVGNVSKEVTEGLLVETFTAFGTIESVTVYSQRNYAFINFKDVENARDAKNGLQGIVIGGLALRIEFAKGAKPSRHLWIGGIGQTVSREVIEGEFKRFGIMEEFKFLRDRNCAFVDYEKIEDAISAVDSLNRKRLGDEELRVDFGRSQPPKRDIGGRPSTATSHEEWGGPHFKDNRDHPDQLRILADSQRSLPDARQSDRGSSGGSFRGSSDGYQTGAGPGSIVVASGKNRGEKEEPSDVLWVGFPLLSKVDEDGLRRAFVPYGEVERVKTFPGRTYAFVQFKKVEEASRAKVALEGKLFNDPRVHIRFSNSEIGPVDTSKTDGNSFSPSRGKDALEFSEKAVGRVAGSDRLGSAIPLRSAGLRPEYFPGGFARGTALPRAIRAGAVISVGRGVGLGPSDPEAQIPRDERDYQTGNLGGRGFSAPGGRLPCDEQLDFRDEERTREAKRPRTVHGVIDGWRWQGTIAKGGTPVCRARCLPVGQGIDVTVPDVVNCTARTDLDMLAKHVYEAGDFGVVFFVPEADQDVPPYHDFMHYLGEKHRAGVAKLVDGTTLFLVPPSEFSERVLKVPGNNCLFGVVLKAQQPSPVEHSHLQQLQPHAPLPRQHLTQPLLHPSFKQAVSHQQQQSHPQQMILVNGHLTRENGTLPASPGQNLSSPAPTSASIALNQSGWTTLADGIPTVLTPELIASLTALLPAQNQPSAPSGPQRMSGSGTQSVPMREGIGVRGILGRIVPNSGSSSSVSANVDNRPAYRPLQSHHQPVVQSQSWDTLRCAQSNLHLGVSGQVAVHRDQGSAYGPPKQQQPQASASVAIAPAHPGPTLGVAQHAFVGRQSQCFQGSGSLGQPLAQHPRPSQQHLELGSALLLPSEQLAQLTALLTQRQQQPAQQQQAAQLLQQHYQQQGPFSPLPQQHQQPVVLPSHQPQAQTYVQQPQYQQQLYAPHAASQHCDQVGPLPQHLSQSQGHLHVLSGGWDGVTVTEGQQQHQQLAASPTVLQSQLSLPQHVQQLLSTGGMNSDQVGGGSQDDTERQKRFQATLQLAAALLQQMQHQQNSGQGNPEQR
ncbi:unnamed protein product [Calypogeia fissa]